MKGGCACGEIRYEIQGEPFAADYCHCRVCQTIAGAPVAAWMDFNTSQVTWHKGTPAEYASSEQIRRGFCPSCGSTLSFRHTQHPDYTTLTITSLDDPKLVKPTYHIYTSSQLPWFSIDDECERFAQGQVTSAPTPSEKNHE